MVGNRATSTSRHRRRQGLGGRGAWVPAGAGDAVRWTCCTCPGDPGAGPGLEAVDGVDPIGNRALRDVAHAGTWAEPPFDRHERSSVNARRRELVACTRLTGVFSRALFASMPVASRHCEGRPTQRRHTRARRASANVGRLQQVAVNIMGGHVRFDICGEYQPLEKLFCNDFVFTIPHHQRPNR